MEFDVVFAGIGGQGVVVLSDIFCEAAILDGFDAAKAEVHGMAQRGGSIVAYARIGNKIESPLIEKGQADVILGFEALETARALPMLKRKGTVIMNTKYIPPNLAFQKSTSKPMTYADFIAIVKKKAFKVHEVDAIGIATRLGNPVVVNTVLLGALSAVPENPLKKETMEKAMSLRLKEKYLEINLKAFQLGRKSVVLG
ncbi:MAG: indolepyruvate oxidoreductase subunit beta [Candidatus Bathyarchaeia archaeon]